MYHYKTIREKASEWRVSMRHIQNLCKSGKIDGAIKEAGIWFIPSDAEVPVKNTKSDAPGFDFVGTKRRIFDKSIKLIKQNGYASVSMIDIADAVGINQSAIYNHFKSKQEILDTIYDYYRHCLHADRPRLAEIEPILKSGTLLDIVQFSRYDFDERYEQRLIDISSIIIHRMTIDQRANDIAKRLLFGEGIHFVEAVFDRAIEQGRLAPIDTHAMAVFVFSIRLFTLLNHLLDPSSDYTAAIHADEMALYEYATSALTDLRPSGERDAGTE